MSGLQEAIAEVRRQEEMDDAVWEMLERERPTHIPPAEKYESYIELSRKGTE